MGTAGLKPVDVFTAGPASEKPMRHSREIKARVIGGVELTLGRLQHELWTLSTPHLAWNGAFLSYFCHEEEQKGGVVCCCGFFVVCGFGWFFFSLVEPVDFVVGNFGN